MPPTHIAQGFLRLLLNNEEAKDVLKIAKKLGRYLIPYEVTQILAKPTQKTLNQMEEDKMYETWKSFCKANHLETNAAVTDNEILSKWWAWVVANYREPVLTNTQWQE